jgi:hypothetical protein
VFSSQQEVKETQKIKSERKEMNDDLEDKKVGQEEER